MALGACKSCGESTYRQWVKHIFKCYIKVIYCSAEQGWKLIVPRLRAHGRLQMPAPTLCHIAITIRDSAWRSSLAPAEDTSKWARVFASIWWNDTANALEEGWASPLAKRLEQQCPPSVRRSASGQHCRGSSSSRKLCFSAFFTGVSQAWIFTLSVLLGKHAIQWTEAKIYRGTPPIFISSFYFKLTSNNLVVNF